MKNTPATPHSQLERLKKSLGLYALLGLGLVGCSTISTLERVVQPAPSTNPVTPKPDPVTPAPVAPKPTLDLSPLKGVVLEANGSSQQAFQATLTDSSEVLRWSIVPNVGSLSSDTGASVTYTSPSSVSVETSVNLTVKSAGLERTITLLLKPVPVVVVPPSPPPVVVPNPTLSLSHSSVVLTANGSSQQAFQATLTNSSETLNWTLSPNLGTLSSGTGPGVTYTSPSSVSVETSVTLKVQGAGLERTATILLKPVPVVVVPPPPPPPPVVVPNPTLVLTPSSVTLTAGDAGKTFQATLTDSSATLNWTLSPNLGTLSSGTGPSVTYTPPNSSSVSVETSVTLKVQGASLERTATILLKPVPVVVVPPPPPPPPVVVPNPTLVLTPSSVTLTAGDAGKTFQATLTDSSATLNWTLSPNLGTLSSGTGPSVTYTPPNSSSVSSQTVVTLKVVGAGLERSATITLNPVPVVIVDTPAPTPSDTLKMLSAINAVRAQGRNCGSITYPAVPALKWNALLERTALLHSQDMANRNYFDHTNPEGQQPWDRMTAQGYNWSAAGENIAAGQRTLEEVMQGWVGSAGHCKNLMSSGFTEVGMARFDKAGTTYGVYWTQNFGKPR